MTKGKTTQIEKDPENEPPLTILNLSRSYRLIWNILTALIRVETYYLLISRRPFHEEPIQCHLGTRETVDLLDTDQHLLKDRKTRRNDTD